MRSNICTMIKMTTVSVTIYLLSMLDNMLYKIQIIKYVILKTYDLLCFCTVRNVGAFINLYNKHQAKISKRKIKVMQQI